jgi:hypothetical protein
LQARRVEVDQALAQARQSIAAVHNGAPLAGRVEALQRHWQGVAESVHARTIAAPQSFAQHSAVVAEQLALLDAIVDQSTLALDPEAATYYTINSVFGHLPRLSESLGQMRARGATVLAKGEAGTEERMRIASIADLAALQLRNAGDALDKAMVADPAMREALAGSTVTAAAAAAEMLKVSDQRLVRAEALDLKSADYYQSMTQGDRRAVRADRHGVQGAGRRAGRANRGRTARAVARGRRDRCAGRARRLVDRDDRAHDDARHDPGGATRPAGRSG